MNYQIIVLTHFALSVPQSPKSPLQIITKIRSPDPRKSQDITINVWKADAGMLMLRKAS